MSYWKDKVALITGGSGGLGLALARTFGLRGTRVVIASRGAENLNLAAESLRSEGADVLAVTADVTRQEDVETLVRRCIERFGRIDVLVNNAGRSARGEILATSPNDFHDLMELNLIAAVRCTQAAAEHLLATQGHVVNIGSLASKCAARYLGAYPASKFALAGYSQQLRLELSPRGLHVLLVCPGPITREKVRQYGSSVDMPESASKPGGGVKVRGIDPDDLSRRILRACERRRLELVVPTRAKLLFAVAAVSPRLGDWMVRKMT